MKNINLLWLVQVIHLGDDMVIFKTREEAYEHMKEDLKIFPNSTELIAEMTEQYINYPDEDFGIDNIIECRGVVMCERS